MVQLMILLSPDLTRIIFLSDLHRQIDELTSKVSSLQSENQALHSRTNILEKVLDMRNEQIQVMQETKETSATLAGQDDELSALQDMGGKLITLTPEIIKDLSSDQIYKIYQMYVRELSSLVNLEKSNESHLTPEQVTQLESLVKDLVSSLKLVGCHWLALIVFRPAEYDDYEAGRGQAPRDPQVHCHLKAVPGQHRVGGH